MHGYGTRIMTNQIKTSVTLFLNGDFGGECSFCHRLWLVQRPVASRRVFVCPDCAKKMMLVNR